MTSYYAYDNNLPCQNPNCKSHGKPHPNCKCYGGAPSGGEHSKSMAEGGEVESYCSLNKPHNKECEYYAEGGEVIPKHDDHHAAAVSYLGNSGLHGLIKMHDHDVDRYNHSIKRGHKNMSTRIEHLFGNEPSQRTSDEKMTKLIHEWIERGGIDQDIQEEIHSQHQPEMFADGGDVKPRKGISSQIAETYPEQNILLQSAKARMSGYLNSIKPQKNQPKLAFDDEPDQTLQKRSYQRALQIAADPFRILTKIKDGTIEPEHVKHFKAMYPEVDDVLQKKLTEKIIKHQLDGKKPSYKIRQGLSLLFGVPLSAEMTPQNIMAAQATFQGKQQQQPQAAPKQKPSALQKSDDSYLTGNQARIARSQKQ